MTTYRFKTKCPRCGNVGEVVADNPAPTVCCGDCLIERVEVVNLETSLTEKQERP